MEFRMGYPAATVFSLFVCFCCMIVGALVGPRDIVTLLEQTALTGAVSWCAYMAGFHPPKRAASDAWAIGGCLVSAAIMFAVALIARSYTGGIIFTSVLLQITTVIAAAIMFLVGSEDWVFVHTEPS
jgi:hypothetical protein